MDKKSLGFKILLGISSLILLSSCKQKQAAPRMATYPVIKLQKVDRMLENKYPASIQGRQDIEIYPQVSGVITKLAVKEGEQVKKGQTLFIIDQVPYQAALRTAEANVSASKANLATAKLTYKSQKTLFEEKVVSEFDLLTAQNRFKTAEASLATAEAQAINARNNLSYTVIKSPCNGVVGSFPFRVGTLVSPSIPQPLTTVSDNSKMYVYFSLSENQMLQMIRQYSSLDSALVQMPPVQLELIDGSIYKETGRIESMSGVIDKNTGAIQVRATFDNTNKLLHSGGAGNIVVPYIRKGCIVVPQTAVVEMQDKKAVYFIKEGKAAPNMITVAPYSNGKEYIVESGLKEGDEIVATGAGLIRPGMPIMPQQASGNSKPQHPQTNNK